MKNYDEKEFPPKGEQPPVCNQAILMWLGPLVFLLGFVCLMVAAAVTAALGSGWAAVAPYVIFAGLCLLLCAAASLALIFSALLWSGVQGQGGQP